MILITFDENRFYTRRYYFIKATVPFTKIENAEREKTRGALRRSAVRCWSACLGERPIGKKFGSSQLGGRLIVSIQLLGCVTPKWRSGCLAFWHLGFLASFVLQWNRLGRVATLGEVLGELSRRSPGCVAFLYPLVFRALIVNVISR